MAVEVAVVGVEVVVSGSGSSVDGCGGKWQ